MVGPFIPGLGDWTSEDHDEVVLFDHGVGPDVIIALQKDVNFAFLNAILHQAQPVEASMLEVRLRAALLTLRKDAKHQLDLAIERGQLACDVHDNLLFELLGVDQVLRRFEEKSFVLRRLELNNVDKDLELTNFLLSFDILDWVLIVHGTASSQVSKWNLGHADHVIVHGVLLVVEADSCNRGVVIEQNHVKCLFLEVLDGLGVDKHLVREGVVEFWACPDRVLRVPVIKSVELVEEEGRHIHCVRVGSLQVMGRHD